MSITVGGVVNGSGGDSSGKVLTTDDTDSVALAITYGTGTTAARLLVQARWPGGPAGPYQVDVRG